MSKNIWVRKGIPSLNRSGYWDRMLCLEDNLTPVVDGTDHFTFADSKGHQMQVFKVTLETVEEPGVGPCLHIWFYCPDCDSYGQRKIYMNGKVRWPLVGDSK